MAKEICYSTNALIRQGRWRNKAIVAPYKRAGRSREELLDTFGEFAGFDSGLGKMKKPKILKAVQKGSKAVAKGTVKVTKATGKGIVKGGKAVGKGVVKGAKFIAKGTKKLAQAVVKAFNATVIKGIAATMGKKKGMAGFPEDWGLGIDAKQTSKDTAGYSAEFLKSKQNDIITKVGTASLAAAVGGPTAPAIALSALAPYGASLAKEGAAYVAEKLLTGKPATMTPADLDKSSVAAVEAASGEPFYKNKWVLIGGGVAALGLVAMLMMSGKK